VFTAKELGQLATARYKRYEQKYFAKHKKQAGKGVHKVCINEAAPIENQWKKIETRIRPSTND